ncbi:MAG: proteasome non-ATPase regulatory subunit 10 [Candidatus Dependentiae bacterium]|nr:proteasome non-ATPase regulatory subunit 10 [Candidatus Dependentiae bacterium]
MNKNYLILLAVTIFSVPLQGQDKELLVAPTISIGTGLGMLAATVLAYAGCGVYAEMRKAAREFKKDNSPARKEQWEKARSTLRKLLGGGAAATAIMIYFLLKDLKRFSEHEIARENAVAEARSLAAGEAEKKASWAERMRKINLEIAEERIASEREDRIRHHKSNISGACCDARFGDFSRLEKAVKDAETSEQRDDYDYRAEAVSSALTAYDNRKLVAYLLDPHCSIYAGLDERGLMRLALRTGKLEAVATALEHGAAYDYSMEEIGKPTIMDEVLSMTDFPLARTFIKHGILPNTNTLINALRTGNIRAVNFLIKEGAISINAINDAGDTPLLFCVKEEKLCLPSVRSVLAHRANVEVRDRWGLTPLVIVAKGGKDELVQILLDEGKADINARADGLTALGHAVRGGHATVAKDLLNRGAIVDDSIRDELARLLPGDVPEVV